MSRAALPSRPGAILGYTKRGVPIRLQAGGDGTDDTDKKDKDKDKDTKPDPTRLSHKQAVNRLKDIRDEAERIASKESRTLEDDRSFAELVAEADVLDEHIRRLERDADIARVRAAAERGHTERGDDPYGEITERTLNPDSVKERRFRDPWDLSEIRAGLAPSALASEYRARALSAIERMPATDDKRREVMTRFIERFETRDARMSQLALAISSEAYVSAFGRILANRGETSLLESEEREALMRAMSLTDAQGGFLIPFQLDPSVINTADGSVNEVRQMSRVVVAVSDVWNGVSSSGVTSRWAGEATEAGDDSPSFEQPTVPVHKLDIFVPISIEGLQDMQNVAQEVAEMIAFEKEERESTAFVTGTGSGQPTGIVTALDANASSEVAAATADEINLVDVYALDDQLPARYRRRGSWLAHRGIYNAIRQFDTAGGAALWETLGGDVPSLLLGRPPREAENMESNPAATAGASNDNILAFGDFMNYVIADRIGTTVEFIPHLFGTNNRPTGQRGWYAYARVGADSVNDGAFRLLQS